MGKVRLSTVDNALLETWHHLEQLLENMIFSSISEAGKIIKCIQAEK